MEKVKVFQYIEIDSNLKSKYKELENYNCFQLLGRNFLSAIFFSLVDYILSNKIIKYLDQFLIYRCSNQISQRIQKVLQQQKISPSIKTFIEEVITIDPENVGGGILLDEMLKIKYGYNYDKSQFLKLLQKIEYIIPISISIVGQFSSSQGISKIKILQSDKGFYLAKYNPDFIILKKCTFCQQKHEKGFTNKGCQHNICPNCIQMRFQNSNQSLIACSQFTCPRIPRMDIEKYFQNNVNINTGQQNQSQNTQNSQSQNNLQLSASSNFNENKNQVKMEQNQNQNLCSKCFKEQKQELFTNTFCNHKQCVNCLKQNLRSWCPISKCEAKIDIAKAQIYLEKQKQLANRDCAKCYKIIKDGEQFFTNTCLHNICNNCLKIPIFKINNESNYCPSSICKFRLDKNMLEEYLKIEKVQFECCKCKELWIWDNMYCNPNCSHIVCFSCAQQMIQKEQYSCPGPSCSKNFFCQKFEKFYEEQQLKLINEQEKLIKQKEEEDKNQQELKKQEELKKAEEEKQLQKGIENSFTTQPVVKSRFLSSKQQNQQNPQQIIIKEIDIDQFQEQKSQIIIKQDDQNNSQKNLRSQYQEQQRFKDLEIGECTQCFSPFSQYNLKQQINCQIHQIGVCCFIKTSQCPQCESKRNTSQIYRPKPKLIIECLRQEDLENTSYLKNQSSPYSNYVDDSRVNTRLTQTQSQNKSTQRNSTMDNNLFRSQIGVSNTQKQQYGIGYLYRR